MPGSCQPLDSNRTTLIFTAVSTRELPFRLPPDQSLRPFEACLPRTAKQPPTGPGWIHEIKHDGFRILARRDARGVRLFTRNGYNFAPRFPRIAEAIKSLSVQSCIIDGEAIVVDKNGLSVFDLIRYHKTTAPPCSARST